MPTLVSVIYIYINDLAELLASFNIKIKLFPMM